MNNNRSRQGHWFSARLQVAVNQADILIHVLLQGHSRSVHEIQGSSHCSVDKYMFRRLECRKTVGNIRIRQNCSYCAPILSVSPLLLGMKYLVLTLLYQSRSFHTLQCIPGSKRNSNRNRSSVNKCCRVLRKRRGAGASYLHYLGNIFRAYDLRQMFTVFPSCVLT